MNSKTYFCVIELIINNLVIELFGKLIAEYYVCSDQLPEQRRKLPPTTCRGFFVALHSISIPKSGVVAFP